MVCSKISELSYRNQSGIDNNNNNNNRSHETLSIIATLNNTNNASDATPNRSANDTPQGSSQQTAAVQPNLMQWRQVDDVRDENSSSMSSQSSGFSNIASPNPYRELIVDDESNFEVEYQKNVTSKFVNTAPTYFETRRPSIITKQNPENDDPLRYKALKFLPGNSTYASVTKRVK